MFLLVIVKLLVSLLKTSKDHSGQLVAIVGIGVNVNGLISQFVQEQAELQTSQGLVTTAITLEEACGHVVSRELFIASLLYQIEIRYLALQQEAQETTMHHSGSTSRYYESNGVSAFRRLDALFRCGKDQSYSAAWLRM